jgi:hypothetical protein
VGRLVQPGGDGELVGGGHGDAGPQDNAREVAAVALLLHLAVSIQVGAYVLTDLGAAVCPALETLDSWARRWSRALALREQNIP